MVKTLDAYKHVRDSNIYIYIYIYIYGTPPPKTNTFEQFTAICGILLFFFYV